MPLCSVIDLSTSKGTEFPQRLLGWLLCAQRNAANSISLVIQRSISSFCVIDCERVAREVPSEIIHSRYGSHSSTVGSPEGARIVCAKRSGYTFHEALGEAPVERHVSRRNWLASVLTTINRIHIRPRRFYLDRIP
ncbi:hypothetical protein V2G26_007380 [Clonostachys chloroleuca]